MGLDSILGILTGAQPLEVNLSGAKEYEFFIYFEIYLYIVASSSWVL